MALYMMLTVRVCWHVGRRAFVVQTNVTDRHHAKHDNDVSTSYAITK